MIRTLPSKGSIKTETGFAVERCFAIALIEPLDGKVRIIFDEPQKSVTAGQSMVFYDGDIVLGGGIIEKNVKAL